MTRSIKSKNIDLLLLLFQLNWVLERLQTISALPVFVTGLKVHVNTITPQISCVTSVLWADSGTDWPVLSFHTGHTSISSQSSQFVLTDQCEAAAPRLVTASAAGTKSVCQTSFMQIFMQNTHDSKVHVNYWHFYDMVAMATRKEKRVSWSPQTNTLNNINKIVVRESECSSCAGLKYSFK